MPPCGYEITWLTAEAGQFLSGLNYYGDGDFLSSYEREKLSGIRFTRRSSDYLLGRRAAKTLLRRTCPDLAQIPESTITIDNTPDGAPIIGVEGMDHYPGCLSITHRRNLALAAYCSAPECRIGIDLEIIEERHESFLLDYFTQREITVISSRHGEERWMWMNLAWSMKEAVLKALGTGLRLDTRSIEVGLAPGFINLDDFPLQWHVIPLRSTHIPEGSVCGWWQQRGELIFTLAAICSRGKNLNPDEFRLIELRI